MKLNQLAPKQSKKRIRRGQGSASGNGDFSGRGCKGQNARAGGGVRLGFEGGQSGLLARMPKMRGFRNPNRVEAQVLNLEVLEALFSDGEKVSLETLLAKGAISGRNAKVKILGKGDIKKKLEISPEILLSASAKEALVKAGGKVPEVSAK